MQQDKEVRERFKSKVVVYACMNFVLATLQFVLPVSSGNIMNELSKKGSWSIVRHDIFIIIFAQVVILVVGYFATQYKTRMYNEKMYEYIADASKHASELPHTYYKNINPIEFINKNQFDIKNILAWRIDGVTQLIKSVTVAMISLGVIASRSVYLLLLYLLIALIYMISYHFFEARLLMLNNQSREFGAIFLDKLTSLVRDIKKLKIYNTYNSAHEESRRVFDVFLKNVLKNLRLGLQFSLIDLLYGNLVTVTAMLVCSYYIIYSSMNIGDFATITLTSNYFLSSVKELFGLRQIYDIYKVARKNYYSFLHTEPVCRADLQEDAIYTIDVYDLTVAYPIYGEYKILADGLNFSLKRGKIYRIIGPNGAGKTSLLDMLFFGDPHRQKDNVIIVNKNRAYSLSRTSLISKTAYYSQNSAYDLLAFQALSEQEKDKFQNIAIQFGISRNNLNRILSEGIYNVSEGERQKLCLAHCLSIKRDIYFMDEPLSSLDQAAQSFFWSHVQKLKKDAIILVVNHHLSTQSGNKMEDFTPKKVFIKNCLEIKEI